MGVIEEMKCYDLVTFRSLYTLFGAVFLILSNPFVGSPEECLIFVGNDDLRPLLFSQNGDPKGLVVDIVREMADRVGLNVDVKVLEWGKAQEMVLQGDADGLLQINKTDERESLYDFSVPLLRSDFTIFRRLDRVDIVGIGSLKGQKVGVESMGYPCSVLGDEPGISLRYISDWQEGFKLVSSGKIDAIVADRWIGEYELFLSGFNDIVPVHRSIQTDYTYIAVKKGSLSLLDTINRGLTEIKSDGSMDKIIAQWSGKKIVYLSREKMKFYYIISFLAVVNVILLVVTLGYSRLLMQSKKETERLANTDSLTKLLNRRSFYDRAERILLATDRKERPVSLIQIDIDSFKTVNDSWGHLFGDMVLVAVANCIEESVGDGGICARMGGDEFTVFLSDSDGEDAAGVAGRIRRSVALLKMEASGQDIKVSVSIGVTTDEKADSTLEELIYHADEALYRAKRLGRDRVERENL